MLSTTSEGDAYTFREFSEMCGKAGFQEARRVALDPAPQSLVLARKPS